MTLSKNEILITGGASGIGLQLALEFKRLGNRVVVAGRTKAKLDRARDLGLQTLSVDLADVGAIRRLAAEALEICPNLNVVIHNAGVMTNEKLTATARDNDAVATETVATNLLGPILLTNALLAHLLKQKAATIVTVTSGLAFVPLAMTPTYSATKAAIHSYTQSLRYQLKDTAIEVKELVPPYVRTSLMGDRQAGDANAMPPADFVAEVFAILTERPDAPEIAVERVRPQRTAGFDRERYEEFFLKQNEAVMSARRAEWEAL